MLHCALYFLILPCLLQTWFYKREGKVNWTERNWMKKCSNTKPYNKQHWRKYIYLTGQMWTLLSSRKHLSIRWWRNDVDENYCKASSLGLKYNSNNWRFTLHPYETKHRFAEIIPAHLNNAVLQSHILPQGGAVDWHRERWSVIIDVRHIQFDDGRRCKSGHSPVTRFYRQEELTGSLVVQGNNQGYHT